MQDRLQPDCSRCADLCCIAYAFDAGHGFGVDKAPDAPCPNLAACHGCQIHSDLKDKGFSGCVQYDCHGAGVRVTQELFEGADWRADARLIDPMCDALRKLAPLHAQVALMSQALLLDLPALTKSDLSELIQRALACDVSEADRLTRDAQELLQSLRSHLSDTNETRRRT